MNKGHETMALCKSLLSDERAVSPVIGVVMMVAVTVILASIIGMAVLQMGGDVNTGQPSVTINGEGSPGANWTLTHAGGDVISEDLSVRYTSPDGSENETWDAKVNVGAEHTTEKDVAPGSTIRVVWTSSDGGQEYVLSEIQVP